MCIKDKQVIVGVALLVILGGYFAILCRLYYKLLLRNSILYSNEVDLAEED